jgi:ABC-type oligopeptide transport system substrate-binding subunit
VRHYELCRGSFCERHRHLTQLGLCRSYEVSEDECTYTFTLRDTVWSNGDPVVADDFIYAWHRNALAENGAADFQYQIEMAAIKNYAMFSLVPMMSKP